MLVEYELMRADNPLKIDGKLPKPSKQQPTLDGRNHPYSRRTRHRAVLCAVYLHLHDVRLPALHAGMAHSADTRSLHLVWQCVIISQCTQQAQINIEHCDRHQAPAHCANFPRLHGGSFNTRAIFHGRSEHFLRAIKPGFIVLTFALPLLLRVAGISTPKLLIAAFFYNTLA